VTGDIRVRTADAVAEIADELPHPLWREGMSRSVLGVAVQWQVGKHDSETM
jgi:hypothetical protein